MTPGEYHPTLPAYGSHTLADLGPAVLGSLGVHGATPGLGLGEMSRVVLLLIDGMGAELLARHADLAPFLSSLATTPLTAGFPTTTVTSLSSLGTGLVPGEHGFPGYTSWVPELAETMSWLTWTPTDNDHDLRERLVPEQAQPRPTIFERAVADGVEVTQCAPEHFIGSGLTRAVLRGATFPGAASSGDVLVQAAKGARRGSRSLVYCYSGKLDTVGHVRGPGSPAWCEQLRIVDAFARRLHEMLPGDATLLVTADHGMVRVGDENKVDVDEVSDLRAGVAAMAGEPRARQVHARPGAGADVLAAWTEHLGERMWVLTGDEAVTAGLFGPVVTDVARSRIGDVLAIARSEVAVVAGRSRPREAALLGHHGALTPDELGVPLLRA